MNGGQAYRIYIAAGKKFGFNRVELRTDPNVAYSFCVAVDGVEYTGKEPVPAQELAEWDKWDMEKE